VYNLKCEDGLTTAHTISDNDSSLKQESIADVGVCCNLSAISSKIFGTNVSKEER